MKKLGLILLLVIGITSLSKAQLSLEEQVADSACVCLNNVDTAQIIKFSNAIKMQCFSEAVAKNEVAIRKNYETEKRREEDAGKVGIGGSLLIKVENELAKSCEKYALVTKYQQSYRESSKAAEKMGEKK